MEAIHLASVAAKLRVRAVVTEQEATYDALRPLLTRREGLGNDVVEWLRLRGLHLPDAVARILENIFDCGQRYRRVSQLLECVGEAGTTVRTRLQKAGLPPPRAWLGAARALHTALRVQAQPARPLLTLAFEFGYADHSCLNRQLGRAFGVPPGRVRGSLGWEWLLARWLRREGVDRERARDALRA
ncbi:MAG: hypothetical protein PVG79_09755 [Gemmatimonadales bacterium]